MHITPSCAQHIGKREQQQDAFIFSDLDNVTAVREKGALAVVADGMGGMAMGQEASILASKVVLQTYQEASGAEATPDFLLKATHQANDMVFQMASDVRLAHQVGTTLISVIIKDQKLYWNSVGDSGLYLIRNGEIAQLNHEHTYARKLNQDLHIGRIKRAQAMFHPERQALTSFIGLTDLNEIDANIKPFPLQEEDCVLLCSDGLNGTLTSDEILRLVQQHGNDAPDALVEATLDRALPHQDNVTVVMLRLQSTKPATTATTTAPKTMPTAQPIQQTRQLDAIDQKTIQKETQSRKWLMPLLGVMALALIGYGIWNWFFANPEGFVYMGKRNDGQTTDIRGYFRSKTGLDEGTLVKNVQEHTLRLGNLSQSFHLKWQLMGIVRSEKTAQDHLVFQNANKDSLFFAYYEGSGFRFQPFAGKYDDFERFAFFRPYTDKNITDPKLLEAVPSKGLELPQQNFMPRQTQWETLLENQRNGKALFDSVTVRLYPEYSGIKPLKKRLTETLLPKWTALKSAMASDKRFTLPPETRLDDWRIVPVRYADATEAWLLIFGYNQKLDEWTVYAAEKGRPTAANLPNIVQFISQSEVKLTFPNKRVYKINLDNGELAEIQTPPQP